MFRCGIALLLLCGTPVFGADLLVTEAQVRSAVDKALPLIQSSAIEFTKQRDCFSCHHQAMSVQVLKSASGRGFAIDKAIIDDQVAWTVQFLKRNQERYLEGHGQGGQVDTAGYALWTLAIGDYPSDDLTAAVCHYLLVRHQEQDHWKRTSTRPPSEASDFTTTFLAVQSLQTFATPEQSENVQQRINRAREWLKTNAANDTEDMVFRLRGLHTVDAESELLSAAAEQIIAQQREDGGWAQNGELGSDAYATGTVLTTLVECGQLTSDDLRYQRGLKWLIDTQCADGSWHVPTRSEPIQVYFESGFPHAQDQFISMSGTCWAALALLYALPTEQENLTTH